MISLVEVYERVGTSEKRANVAEGFYGCEQQAPGVKRSRKFRGFVIHV